ncbi:tripartite tricarboxylate transporter substrate binding protein [Pigmentiphaga soli]|uniref:Tripartite tricarboxylate transporter substrate binding protein n=1 Tax=Pigmentiphaga soli TaxID=1007095 RepID=A0ABP8HNV7_9BURK
MTKSMKTLAACGLFAAFAAGAGQAAAAADAYPNRPIRLIVGFAPGGSVDTVARLLAQRLGEALGQPVVIENRPGADSNIANEFVARADPDGYTLLLNTGALAINVSLYKHVRYDAIRDFVPISMVGKSNIVLVTGPGMPVKSYKELYEKLRANPGKFNYSSAGGPQLLAAELYKQRTGTDVVRISYKGGGPSINAVMSGEVQMSFSNIPTVMPHVKSGRLRILAVADDHRNPSIPDVPTFKEQGVDMNVSLWQGMFAPAGTPQPVIDKLYSAVTTVAKSEEFRKQMAAAGVDVVANTPAEFSQQVQAEVKQWAEVIRISGAAVD